MRKATKIIKYILRAVTPSKNPKQIWADNLSSEIAFWDNYLNTKGSTWPEDFKFKTDPDSLLQNEIAAEIPDYHKIQILDVGAGPLTVVGKKAEGYQIDITATDPLADQYDILLNKYNISPIVRTIKISAEELSSYFSKNTFDIVYARNCLDHSYDPLKAIYEMINVCKDNCSIILRHSPNEANQRDFKGLHQWNFNTSDSNDFIIESKNSKTNVTKLLAGKHLVICNMVDNNKWLDVIIRKNYKLK